ncbi:MAG: hypothetical protein ISR50_06045 [Alphaproteobacteria bacterium]|nr:hypothetical protein [Alphaproteobacteria bacterium]
MDLARSDFTRPITLAITFTLFGEASIFFLWGVHLFPNGVLWHKVAWTGVCGLAMGATIGALVNVVVTGRVDRKRAVIWSSFLYFGVLALCTLFCFQIDLATGSQFGAREEPLLFIAGGLIPALASSVVYSWALYSETGTNLLSRLGY